MKDGCAQMNPTKAAVLTVLVLVNVAFVLGWIRAARRQGLRERPTLGDFAIGVLTVKVAPKVVSRMVSWWRR